MGAGASAVASFLLRLSSLIPRIQIPFHFCNGFTSPIVVIKTSSPSSSSHSRAKNQQQRGVSKNYMLDFRPCGTHFLSSAGGKLESAASHTTALGISAHRCDRASIFSFPQLCQHSDKRHTYLYMCVYKTVRARLPL
jgi:hypothetical protein